MVRKELQVLEGVGPTVRPSSCYVIPPEPKACLHPKNSGSQIDGRARWTGLNPLRLPDTFTRTGPLTMGEVRKQQVEKTKS